MGRRGEEKNRKTEKQKNPEFMPIHSQVPSINWTFLMKAI
ncbi:hypothetical protein yfred0001_4950 [Yersinia frederiksenii ATCC 33641]|nr:hypothetical protein yfred0001_4950 [Yersinia frederiksenii ATCC 33641]